MFTAEACRASNYLLRYRSITIDVDASEYLSNAVSSFNKQVLVLVVQQPLQLRLLYKLLPEQLLKLLRIVRFRRGLLQDVLDQDPHEELTELVDCDPAVSIEVDLLELLGQLLPLVVMDARQLDSLIDRVRVGQARLSVLLVDDLRAVRRRDPRGQECVHVRHYRLLLIFLLFNSTSIAVQLLRVPSLLADCLSITDAI